MDFTQKKRVPNNENRYSVENLKKSRDFTKQLLDEMDELVRSVVLFGSTASKSSTKNSDIDILIVLDNVSVYVSEELREAYRIITDKITSQVSDNFHIMTINLSDLWDMARKGDPVLINILRKGMPLFDRDLIEPMQYLLEIGKIRPTRESVANYMTRSKTLLHESDFHIHEAFLDIYYSVVDAIHSALMSEGVTPPSPAEMPKEFKKTFKQHSNLVGYYDFIKQCYTIAKDIEHKKNLDKYSGTFFDEFKSRADAFVKDVSLQVEKTLEKKDMFEL